MSLHTIYCENSVSRIGDCSLILNNKSIILLLIHKKSLLIETNFRGEMNSGGGGDPSAPPLYT